MDLKCAAPRCPDSAETIIIGMSLCGTHRKDWSQINAQYYAALTIPELQKVYRELIPALQPLMEELAQNLPVVSWTGCSQGGVSWGDTNGPAGCWHPVTLHCLCPCHNPGEASGEARP